MQGNLLLPLAMPIFSAKQNGSDIKASVSASSHQRITRMILQEHVYVTIESDFQDSVVQSKLLWKMWPGKCAELILL